MPVGDTGITTERGGEARPENGIVPTVWADVRGQQGDLWTGRNAGAETSAAVVHGLLPHLRGSRDFPFPDARLAGAHECGAELRSAFSSFPRTGSTPPLLRISL